MTERLDELAQAVDALSYSEMMLFIEAVGQASVINASTFEGAAELSVFHTTASDLADWATARMSHAVDEDDAEASRQGRDFMAKFYGAIEALLQTGPHIVGALDHHRTNGAKGYLTGTPDDDRDHFAELLGTTIREFNAFRARHIDDAEEGGD